MKNDTLPISNSDKINNFHMNDVELNEHISKEYSTTQLIVGDSTMQGKREIAFGDFECNSYTIDGTYQKLPLTKIVTSKLSPGSHTLNFYIGVLEPKLSLQNSFISQEDKRLEQDIDIIALLLMKLYPYQNTRKFRGPQYKCIS